MGNRLSRLYTRTGDDGTTGLAGGDRVEKDSPRVRTMGAVDEVNSILGLLVANLDTGDISELLLQVQHHLFNLGGELSMPGHELLDEKLVGWLEGQIDSLNEDLGPLKEFILPGGSGAAAVCHMARAVTRRAEREMVTLGREEDVRDCLLVYLNRLSDLLFVLARRINADLGTRDVFWDKTRAAPAD